MRTRNGSVEEVTTLVLRKTKRQDQTLGRIIITEQYITNCERGKVVVCFRVATRNTWKVKLSSCRCSTYTRCGAKAVNRPAVYRNQETFLGQVSRYFKDKVLLSSIVMLDIH